MIISGSVLLKMINVLDKVVEKNQTIHSIFILFFFRKSCRLYEIVWKHIIEPDRS